MKTIFITGTDTGVGKTLLTALLLHHLRETGVRALAMKPFCSGGRADVKLLQSLQHGELSDAEMNPFYFKQPIAPLIAAEKNHRTICLKETAARIRDVKKKCDCLLIEGSGGLLVPLGKGFTVADLIAELDCRVIVVARNQLGIINHTLLTIKALQSLGKNGKNLVVVLMGAQKPDIASLSNQEVLFDLLKPIKILKIPFLGKNASRTAAVKTKYRKITKTISLLAGNTASS